jgi:hypothetical protein
MMYVLVALDDEERRHVIVPTHIVSVEEVDPEHIRVLMSGGWATTLRLSMQQFLSIITRDSPDGRPQSMY